jgi:hypothetical protein
VRQISVVSGHIGSDENADTSLSGDVVEREPQDVLPVAEDDAVALPTNQDIPQGSFCRCLTHLDLPLISLLRCLTSCVRFCCRNSR